MIIDKGDGVTRSDGDKGIVKDTPKIIRGPCFVCVTEFVVEWRVEERSLGGLPCVRRKRSDNEHTCP